MNKYDYELARKTRMLSKVELIRKIPGMGVDIEMFSPQQKTVDGFSWESFGIESSRKVVLFAGRLVKEKGVFELLKAAHLLRDRNYAFFLLGDGPEYRAAHEFVKTQGLTGQVFLLGWQDSIEKYMRHCNVFVLPTYYFEGLPVTVLEAMASTKPVVATHHRGCEDAIVDGLTGLLVEVRNAKQLAEKIDMVLNNDSLAKKMGIEGRRRAELYFSKKQAVRRFCEEVATVSRYWGWRQNTHTELGNLSCPKFHDEGKAR
jgi:N,N'-diacetylbacillosaminyl-diphospho-undecaprenol alpha-1,3-N-acetylgalactosaminyltransferase